MIMWPNRYIPEGLECNECEIELFSNFDANQSSTLGFVLTSQPASKLKSLLVRQRLY